jgi:hypothetical protein
VNNLILGIAIIALPLLQLATLVVLYRLLTQTRRNHDAYTGLLQLIEGAKLLGKVFATTQPKPQADQPDDNGGGVYVPRDIEGMGRETFAADRTGREQARDLGIGED